MKRCYRCMGELGESPVCPHCGYDSRKGQEIPYALQPGTVLHGKYLIGNVLGQGGFGITYLGFDMILEVKVAIKEYYVSGSASRMGASSQKVYWTADPGDMNHFITEARRMAQLEKMPEIANVRDVFYDNQTTYIIMEYVEGVTLSRYLERKGPLSYEQAVRLMLPVINALGRVHGKGLVHRDISPDNLMREPQGTLRILDMGAAGDLTRNNGQASQLVARRGFSPYEQYMEGGTIGPWTDVYAVCATIYYCCTGRLIPDAFQRMDQYLRTKKTELDLDAAIPPAGAKVLQKGLALEGEHRIRNMAALAEQLKKSLETKKPVIPELKPKPTPKPNPKPKPTPKPKSEPEPEEVWDDEPDPEINPELLSKLKQNQKPLVIGAVAILVIVIGAAVLSSMGGEKKPSIPVSPTETKAEMRIAEETTEETTAVLKIVDSLEMNDVDLGHTELVKVLSGPDAREITWSSSNPQAAVVSENGTVTAAGYGTSEITAEYMGQTAVCTVTVNLRANVTCKYEENETGLTITGYEEDPATGIVLPAEIVLPREIDGKPVTGIGLGASAGLDSFTNVIIPDSVTVIEGSAFEQCTSLTSVTIPNSVTSIGGHAFDGCTSLTSVTIPNSVTEIGEYAFNGCTSLTSVAIPNSVTSIGVQAFGGCTSLTSVTIPDGVTSIGGYVFNGCTSLTSVTIPDGVTSIGGYVFNGCTSLTSVTIPDSVTSIGRSAFEDCPSLTSVTIPDSVTNIGARAFFGCTSLTSVTIPNRVTEIEYSAFSGCTSLTSVTIPNSVTVIGSDAFYGCTSLANVSIPDSVTEIDADAFLNTPWLKNQTDTFVICGDGVLLRYNGNASHVEIPATVKMISDAFRGCTSLQSVTIPNSVTRIGEDAFEGCTSLTSVTIPDSVTEIAFGAFTECTSLTSVTIPDSVTSIGGYAFEGCTSLTSVTIPDSVTQMGWHAFEGCTSLTSVTIPNSVTSIREYAFNGCTSLTSVTIPNSVTGIEEFVFKNCTSLTSITIPESVVVICYEAFAGCTSLTSVTIPESVTKICEGAFHGCDSLKRATISADCIFCERFFINSRTVTDVFPETCEITYY